MCVRYSISDKERKQGPTIPFKGASPVTPKLYLLIFPPPSNRTMLGAKGLMHGPWATFQTQTIAEGTKHTRVEQRTNGVCVWGDTVGHTRSFHYLRPQLTHKWKRHTGSTVQRCHLHQNHHTHTHTHCCHHRVLHVSSMERRTVAKTINSSLALHLDSPQHRVAGGGHRKKTNLTETQPIAWRRVSH